MSQLPQLISVTGWLSKHYSQRIGWTLSKIWQGRSGAAAMVQTFAVQLFILAVNTLTGIVTARSLGPEGRGELAAMVLWPQLISYLLTLGLPASIVYNLKRHPMERKAIFLAGLLIALGLGLLAVAIGVLGLPSWISQYSAETLYRAQVLMAIAPISLLSLTLVAFCEVENDYTVANQSKYLLPVFTLGSLLLLQGLGLLSPVTVALAYMLPSVVIAGWLFRHTARRFHPLRFQAKELSQAASHLLPYGLRCYGIDLLKTLSNRLLGQALVIGFLSPEAMGLYTVSFSISRMLNLFEQAVIAVLVSKTSARPIPEIVDLTGCAARITTSLTVLCVIPLTFLCPLGLELLYGNEFVEAVPVFRWLLLEVTLGGTTWVLAQAFMAAGKPGIVTLSQGAGVACSVPLLLHWVPSQGLIGVGYALLLSTALRFISILAAFPLVLQQPVPSLILTVRDIRFVREKFAR